VALSERGIDRRQFLTGAAGLAGAGLLAACGSNSGSNSGGAPSPTKIPPLSAESGKLSVLDWKGYEAAGTKAQTYPVLFGKTYTKKYGASGLTYSYIYNDNQGLEKATTSGPYDVIHPYFENYRDYVSRGLIQPWDTSLISSFSQLNPAMVKAGQFNGKQYVIPWDWGYGSLLYRTDHVDAADATGWELAWNPKYKDKISLWKGASTNFEIAALKLGFPNMDRQTMDQIAQSKQALIDQKPLNKVYWDDEYATEQPNIKSGTVWITYAWQDSLVSMAAAGVPVAFMNPSQGRISWFGGFMLGAHTQNYYHAHEYVESFVNHNACASLINNFYYGSANLSVKPSEVQNKTLAKSLDLGNPTAVLGGNNNVQSYQPNRQQIELAWQEVLNS